MSADVPWTAVMGVAVASASLAATLVSFAWQTVIWKWSGSKPKVSASLGAVVGPMSGSQVVVMLEARNAGRGACQITQVFFAAPDDMKIVALRLVAGSDSLPITLEGQHAARWIFDAGQVRATVRELGVIKIRPVVVKGSGKLCRGKWSELDKLLRTAE
ncbi:hypothetical protein ACIRF8_15695 [Streptomyces sp. NPDC102406]|uniref:hypothetical protein n=1 Tax=Streptomyces sp. NPDC102406 TaxID=3366171 RepID=UPI003809FC6E